MIRIFITFLLFSISFSTFGYSWNLNSFEKKIKQQIDSITVDNLSQYWATPKNFQKKQCVINYQHLSGSFSFSKTAKRDKSRNLINFANYYGTIIANSIGDNDRQKIKNTILDIANNQYFSKPDMKKGWSPIYVHSNIIRLTAFYIKHLKQLNYLKPEEEEVLVSWINSMIPYQKGFKMNGSDDSRAASGVALMSWGAQTKDVKLFKKGIKNWTESLYYIFSSVGKLKRQDAHQNVSLSDLSLEDEFNLTLGHVVEGYVILENIGFNMSSITFKSNDIQGTVNWWVNELLTKVNWDVVGRPITLENFKFRGLKRSSHNWHLGWIPIYLSNPREDQLQKKLKEIMRNISYGFAISPYIRGISAGVATDCLWGFSPNN